MTEFAVPADVPDGIPLPSGDEATRPAPGSPPAAGGDNRTGTVTVRPLGEPPRPPWWTVPVLTFQTAIWMIAFGLTGLRQLKALKARPEFPWASFCEQFGIEYTENMEGK